MKRFIAVTLSVLTILSTVSVSAADSTRYVYNGNETTASAAVIIKDGYTYLPASQIFKACGMKVIEKTSNNSITAEAKGKPGYVSIWLNKTKGRMNGTNIHLGKAPFKENGVVYVSSKFIEEQLGVKVNYEQSKNTIYINKTGEGKITSTANLNNKAQNTNKSTPVTNSTSSGKNIPDFTAVTGIKSSDKSIYGTVYSNVSKAAIDKYVTTLLSNGYSHKVTGPITGDIFGYVEFSRYASISKKGVSIISITRKQAVNSKYTIAIDYIWFI